MATIHYLNVKEGDCTVIQHDSGRVTVIDVCNAKPTESPEDVKMAELPKAERGVSGDFQQKKYPVNPITYLREHRINSIFRYIQTHPDMDHMDGIKVLFETFKPINFWDTENKKEMPKGSWEGSPYKEEDWEFYKRLRDTSPAINPRRLALLSGDHGKYWNISEDGMPGGDGLYILAPTQKLVDRANETDDYNHCSYVILFRARDHRIVFGGDSHDETWEHILQNYEDKVSNIDLLVAPHHGRDSGRSYNFLDTLRPTLTFFGNARSEHLAYNAWKSRRLQFITNNQANCMVVDTSTTPMTLYVTHENFAQKINPQTFCCKKFKAWYVGPITENLIPSNLRD